MRGSKERLTVTVDAHLIESGNRSVAAGGAKSLSGWVNLALRERVALEERLSAMAEAVAAYEATHGAISANELSAQRRRDASEAIVVRGPFDVAQDTPRRARSRPSRTRTGAG